MKWEEPLEKAKPFAIPKLAVWNAYKKVKANRGAAGIDDVSIEEFEKDLKNNLYKLWNRMSSGSYFPPAVKAVPIPKKGGGTRILGVPSALAKNDPPILAKSDPLNLSAGSPSE
jgi:RNA-directed DNA polymerase